MSRLFKGLHDLSRLLWHVNPGGARRRYAFVFVCQQGELEIQAALLAASLNKFLKCDHELIAGFPVPERVCGTPSGTTIALFKRLGVRTVRIVNKVNPLYTHANKIACLKVRTKAHKIVFLDTDILLLRDFCDEPRFSRDINVKPVDYQTFTSTDELWRIAYKTAWTPMPEERIVSTVSGESGLPYFNSGFIALNRGIPLANSWTKCARAFNKEEAIPKKIPWSDQPSLAVAIHKLKLRYDCLDERYNFPAHVRTLDENNLPWFCHYHYPSIIQREPRLVGLVQELVTAYPEIAELMRRSEKWEPLALRLAI